MVAENNAKGFDRLMQLFVAKQLPWLRDEMYADYLAEKGDLKVEVRIQCLQAFDFKLTNTEIIKY